MTAVTCDDLETQKKCYAFNQTITNLEIEALQEERESSLSICQDKKNLVGGAETVEFPHNPALH